MTKTRIKAEHSADKLAAEYLHSIQPKLIPVPDGSGHSKGEGLQDGWINGLSMKRYHEWELDTLPDFFHHVIRSFRQDQIFQVLFNQLEPGAQLKPHIDGEPYNDRWHLCIMGTGLYMEESKPLLMKPGYWYGPIEYWKMHSMENTGKDPRVNMVVDFYV